LYIWNNRLIRLFHFYKRV